MARGALRNGTASRGSRGWERIAPSADRRSTCQGRSAGDRERLGGSASRARSRTTRGRVGARPHTVHVPVREHDRRERSVSSVASVTSPEPIARPWHGERRSARGDPFVRSAKIRDRAVSPQRGRSGDGVGTEWGRSGDGVGTESGRSRKASMCDSPSSESFPFRARVAATETRSRPGADGMHNAPRSTQSAPRPFPSRHSPARPTFIASPRERRDRAAGPGGRSGHELAPETLHDSRARSAAPPAPPHPDAGDRSCRRRHAGGHRGRGPAADGRASFHVLPPRGRRLERVRAHAARRPALAADADHGVERRPARAGVGLPHRRARRPLRDPRQHLARSDAAGGGRHDVLQHADRARDRPRSRHRRGALDLRSGHRPRHPLRRLHQSRRQQLGRRTRRRGRPVPSPHRRRDDRRTTDRARRRTRDGPAPASATAGR